MVTKPAETAVQFALRVAKMLDSLQIRYFVTGSVAGTFVGEPRSTNDIDIVVELDEGQTREFVRQFASGFYLHPPTVEQAVRQRKSFNMIHFESAQKIDCFVSAGDPYAKEQLARRRGVQVEGDNLYVASAEDTLLNKLRWYQRGGGTSDRQWRDILGILKVQRGRLDDAYLTRWGGELGLSDLLTRAIQECG